MRRLLATFLFCLAALPAQASPYTGLYFFGDSLTDTGNVSSLYAGLPHTDGAPTAVPGPPYDAGGRASNGPIYADTLAAGLGFTASPSAAGGNNYAFGGARTRYQLFGAPFLGILDQVAAFRAQPQGADPGALYVLWGGANNLQDILLGRTTDALGNAIPDLGATVGDIASAILGLYDEGARKLLVPNAPDLALVPRVGEMGAGAQAFAHGLTLAYNTALADAVASLEAAHPDLDIVPFDAFNALYDIIGDPAADGFTDTSHRCYTGDDLTFTGGGTVCPDPDSYLFWDGIHPTSALHDVLANRILAGLQVPEPGTATLVALALVVLTLPRRRWRN